MTEISLSEGEWKIMKLLWEHSPLTIAQMVTALSNDTGWTKTTVFVMLKRLIAKGAVRMDESGRSHEYYPTVSRSAVTDRETESFLSRVYDGSVGMLVSSLAGNRTLSEDDIAELRRILDSAEARGAETKP